MHTNECSVIAWSQPSYWQVYIQHDQLHRGKQSHISIYKCVATSAKILLPRTTNGGNLGEHCQCCCTVKWSLHRNCSDSFGYVPDSKVHGANMGPTWVLSAPDGPHVGPMNLAIRGKLSQNLAFFSQLLKDRNHFWIWHIRTNIALIFPCYIVHCAKISQHFNWIALHCFLLQKITKTRNGSDTESLHFRSLIAV